jgi:hypothetical protein
MAATTENVIEKIPNEPQKEIKFRLNFYLVPLKRLNLGVKFLLIFLISSTFFSAITHDFGTVLGPFFFGRACKGARSAFAWVLSFERALSGSQSEYIKPFRDALKRVIFPSWDWAH